MAKLPSSWGLKTKKRPDGKLDIVGKDDAGKEYTVRTTDTGHVTDRDIRELHDADREAYSGPDRAKQAVKRMFGDVSNRKPTQQELIHSALTFDDSDWIAAAEPIVHAGFGRKGLTTGSTRAYRRGWEIAFGKEN